MGGGARRFLMPLLMVGITGSMRKGGNALMCESVSRILRVQGGECWDREREEVEREGDK